MDYNNYDRGLCGAFDERIGLIMTRTYRWMAGGLLVTFAMAYITATTPLIYLVDSLYFLLTIGELRWCSCSAPGCRRCPSTEQEPRSSDMPS